MAGPEPEHHEAATVPTPREGPVSLAALLAYAAQHAPAIRVARAHLARGDAAIEGAQPLLSNNPQVSVGVGPRIRADGTGVDVQASLQQPLEIAGERGRRLDAARALRGRFEAELDAVRWQVHWEIHAAYHQALVAEERDHAARRVLQFQTRLLEIARQRKKAGEISGLPVRLAEGEVAQAEVATVLAAQRYRALRLRLAQLAGWPIGALPEPVGHLDPPHRAPPLPRILELAARHQPRIAVLQKIVAAAEARAAAAARDGWPEPAIGVQYNRESGPAGADHVVLGTLALPLPLFARNQKERAEARAEAAVARAEAEAFGQQLEARLVLAATAVDAAAERLEVYGAEILPRFATNLDMLQRAFELGEIDILEVSLARDRFFRIQSDALDAYDDYFQAVADLEALVGADLWPEAHHEGRDR